MDDFGLLEALSNIIFIISLALYGNIQVPSHIPHILQIKCAPPRTHHSSSIECPKLPPHSLLIKQNLACACCSKKKP